MYTKNKLNWKLYTFLLNGQRTKHKYLEVKIGALRAAKRYIESSWICENNRLLVKVKTDNWVQFAFIVNNLLK